MCQCGEAGHCRGGDSGGKQRTFQTLHQQVSWEKKGKLDIFISSKNYVNIGLISSPNVNFVITPNIFPYKISQNPDLCDHFVLQYQSINLMALTYTERQIEKWIKVFILRQEVLAEDELEENSDSEERAQSPLGRKISHDRMSGGGTSRKMSAIESMLPIQEDIRLQLQLSLQEVVSTFLSHQRRGPQDGR